MNNETRTDSPAARAFAKAPGRPEGENAAKLTLVIVTGIVLTAAVVVSYLGVALIDLLVGK